MRMNCSVSPQAAAEKLRNGSPVVQGVILGGEVGHSDRKPHGGEGHNDRVDRHNELIKAHHLRADEAGEKDAVDKPQHLGDNAGARQNQSAVQHG